MPELVGEIEKASGAKANPPHSRALANAVKTSETSMTFALLGGVDTASFATGITPNQRRRYDQ
jgi:hypothetical protein